MKTNKYNIGEEVLIISQNRLIKTTVEGVLWDKEDDLFTYTMNHEEKIGALTVYTDLRSRACRRELEVFKSKEEFLAQDV